MARLLTNDAMQVSTIGNNFKFSGIRTAHLGASEYTLVNIGIDVTGSTMYFANQLRESLVAAIESCRKSARADNLLIRVFTFSLNLPDGIEELHGFKPLQEIVITDYPEFKPGGMTNLYDAAYAAVGITNAYAEQLAADEFPCNAINFIITDGEDSDSKMTVASVKLEIEKGIKAEKLESCVNVLIGINANQCQRALNKFQVEGGFDKFIDAGNATPAQLAKLADFVAQSISSQSVSLGSGGPSQTIAATI